MKVSLYVWENNGLLEVKKKIIFSAFQCIAYTYLLVFIDKMANNM